MSQNSENRAVAVVTSAQALDVWSTMEGFEQAQRMARALCSSPMVPDNYRGPDNIGSTLIALDMARRVNANPLMVMQNLHIIEGRPSWSSPFIIAALESCGRFGPIKYRVTDLGMREASYDRWVGPKGERRRETAKVKVADKEVIAYATERATGEVLEGPPVSIGMAVGEGWYTKPGSKWVTMPDLMLRYRAAAFFGRLYAPGLLMGIPTADETDDIVVGMRDITPAVSEVAAEVTTAPAQAEPPKSRPKGVQAVMDKAAPKATRATTTAAQAAPARQEPEVIDVEPEPADIVDAEYTDVDRGETDDDVV